MIEARDIRLEDGFSRSSLLKGNVLKIDEGDGCLNVYLDTGFLLFITGKCIKDIKDYLFASTL